MNRKNENKDLWLRQNSCSALTRFIFINLFIYILLQTKKTILIVSTSTCGTERSHIQLTTYIAEFADAACDILAAAASQAFIEHIFRW